MTTTLAIIATTLAIASFCGTLWRIWRDRPRLIFYVTKANIHYIRDKKKFTITMLQIKACNIGFRPIILTRFVALGNEGSFSMGIHDEPAAAYGVEDQRFPSVLEPGKTLTIHPMSIEALDKNSIDPLDPKVFFDPWKYFVLIDSFGRFHHMKMEDIRWDLGMDKKRVPLKGRQKVLEFFQRKSLFYRAKRKFRITD